jgi:hypothetical protein
LEKRNVISHSLADLGFPIVVTANRSPVQVDDWVSTKKDSDSPHAPTQPGALTLADYAFFNGTQVQRLCVWGGWVMTAPPVGLIAFGLNWHSLVDYQLRMPDSLTISLGVVGWR